MPLGTAGLGRFTGALLGLSVGGITSLDTLYASASYIAVPAAMRIALPEANPALRRGTRHHVPVQSDRRHQQFHPDGAPHAEFRLEAPCGADTTRAICTALRERHDGNFSMVMYVGDDDVLRPGKVLRPEIQPKPHHGRAPHHPRQTPATFKPPVAGPVAQRHGTSPREVA